MILSLPKVSKIVLNKRKKEIFTFFSKAKIFLLSKLNWFCLYILDNFSIGRADKATTVKSRVLTHLFQKHMQAFQIAYKGDF